MDSPEINRRNVKHVWKKDAWSPSDKQIKKASNEAEKMFKVPNRDNGDYVTTNSWKPLFWKIGNHQTVIFALDFALVWKRVSLS